MHNVDHIIEALSKRTQHVFATAVDADRHQRLTQRLERLYGALELARLIDFWLAREIETHLDAVRRDIEVES
jgi:16S rRNA C967 or C1407 C5-methylase (RsmB/RsmF family)